MTIEIRQNKWKLTRLRKINNLLQELDGFCKHDNDIRYEERIRENWKDVEELVALNKKLKKKEIENGIGKCAFCNRYFDDKWDKKVGTEIVHCNKKHHVCYLCYHHRNMFCDCCRTVVNELRNVITNENKHLNYCSNCVKKEKENLKEYSETSDRYFVDCRNVEKI